MFNKNKKVVRVFLSIPMNGLSKTEIISNLATAKQQVRALPLFKDCSIDFLDGLYKPADMLEKMTKMQLANYQGRLYTCADSIQIMSTCDFVYFGDGWEGAQGCKLEHYAADVYMASVDDDEYRLYFADTKVAEDILTDEVMGL